MGWHHEFLCIELPQYHEPMLRSTWLEALLPDLFEATGEVMCYEDATSVQRHTDLCIGQAMGWAFVIDVNCRLSAANEYLAKVSVEGNAYAIRVCDSPVLVHCSRGRKVSRHEGVSACLAC
jgi:hypothetical protein